MTNDVCNRDNQDKEKQKTTLWNKNPVVLPLCSLGDKHPECGPAATWAVWVADDLFNQGTNDGHLP
jgi:hypothetical protein